MAKKKKIQMPLKDFVKEHKRLVGVLNSPSHADDKEEAKRQVEEMKEYTEKSGVSVTCGTGLSGKICRHNRKKLHGFVKNFKKSIDFKETMSAVDTMDQHNAEKTVSPELINYIKSAVSSDISKIPFSKGVLTLSEKEKGLFNGFFQDNNGQIIEKFDNQTIEIVAKNMEIKQLYDRPAALPIHATTPGDEVEDRQIAREEVSEALDTHNKLYHQGQQPGEPINVGKKGMSLKLKFGDFEIELRKSVKDFVNDFRKSKTLVDPNIVQKAIASWRKKNQGVMNLQNNHIAAKELLANWDYYREEFNQLVDALQREDSNE